MLTLQGLCTSAHITLYNVCGFQQKIINPAKVKEKQSLKDKLSSQLDSQMLELSDKDYKISMISMLRALIKKVYNMQEQAAL